jgi:hypothetical protein
MGGSVAGTGGGAGGANPGGGTAGSGGSAGPSAGGTSGGNGDPAPAQCQSVPAPGATWAEMPPAPAEVAGMQVTDAWPAGADDIFFAGNFPDPINGLQGFAVLHWTAGCWTTELIQKQVAAPGAPQIAGTATDDVWLTVGDAIFHRDAQAWTQLDDSWRATITEIAFYGPPVLTDVQPRTRDEVWFATRYAMLRWTGGQWQSWELAAGPPLQSASITWFFNRVWVQGANDIWAGGGSDEIGNTMDPAAMVHFDGNSWTIHNVGAFGVNALWPAGPPNQFWLAMDSDAVEPRTIRFFDGSNRAMAVDIAGFPPSITQTSLWGRSPSDVWAAGADVAHFDGAAWSHVDGTPDAVRDVNHTNRDSVVTGDATATWLAGAGPSFFRKAAP